MWSPCSTLTARNYCILRCMSNLQIHLHRTFTRLFFIHSTDKPPRIWPEFPKNLNRRREKFNQNRIVSFRRLHSLVPFERSLSASSKHGIYPNFRVSRLTNMQYLFYKQSSRVISRRRRRRRRRRNQRARKGIRPLST